MKPVLLSPVFKDYLWGGEKLRTEFHKTDDPGILAESWELSCNEHGLSTLRDTGESLRDFLSLQDSSFLGTGYPAGQEFPILIKLIDAARDLSIQVHPDNVYASNHEHSLGKTEMWVVMDAEPGAFLYYGVNRDCTREELRKAIEEGTVTEYLNAVPVAPGDVFFISPGTIHAIGRGILLAEIQQNSDITYRMYDYNRRGADGQPRRLDIDKSLDVAILHPTPRIPLQNTCRDNCLLGRCPYFTVYSRYDPDMTEHSTAASSFEVLLALNNDLDLCWEEGSMHLGKGSCVLLPAGLGTYSTCGPGNYLRILPCDDSIPSGSD